MPLVPGPDGAITAPDNRRQVTVAVDLIERLLLVAMYIWFLYHILPSIWGQPYNMLTMATETFTVGLVLIRRPGTTATTLYAWAVAFVGTCLPLSVIPGGTALVPVWGAAFIMLYGVLISFSAKLSLRRSFGVVAASRGVRRSGPYRFVRHPMYLGYSLTNIGFLLLNPSLWNLGIYSFTFVAAVLRIGEEEKMLSQDKDYRDYAEAVHSRLIPGLY